MEKQNWHDRNSSETLATPGLLKITKALAKASDRLFGRRREAIEAERLPQVEIDNYRYENFVVTSHKYTADTQVVAYSVLPKPDQVSVLMIRDKIDHALGNEKFLYMYSRDANTGLPRCKQVRQWVGDVAYRGERATTLPENVSLVRALNIQGPGDVLNLPAGSRVVHFVNNEDSPLMSNELMEMPEGDPVRSVFFDARFARDYIDRD